MACSLSVEIVNVATSEFEEWHKKNTSDIIVLVEVSQGSGCFMNLLLGCEYEVKLHIPEGYPDYNGIFFVESDSVISTWANALNQFLSDCEKKVSLSDVLNKAVSLYSKSEKPALKMDTSSEEEEDMDDDNSDSVDNDEEEVLVGEDEAFTTEWDLVVARKKMRWSKKEPLVREMILDKKKQEQGHAGDSKTTEQIFSSHAAFGILTNDLVTIMENEATCGFSAEPIQDNIYHWQVKLFNFDQGSDLSKELSEVKTKYGYNYIEMEMTFEIDLFPFYPPLVKLVRPRLQSGMMQRITNIELLQLSYWSPAKDMKSVIEGIKSFLQQWARIEVDYDRNELTRCPYLDIEHHLLTLAQVSEITPRVNQVYTLDEDKIKELKNTAFMQIGKSKDGKGVEEYWAKGVGFGHNNRPGWDIDAYIAAQKEKDNKIESALKDILRELRTLKVELVPRAGTSKDDQAGCSVSRFNGAGDNVDDIYSVLEGSALIPCLENYLQIDSFLEISRHSVVYTVIVNVIREIAYRKDLLPLLCALPGQTVSVYQLLEHLDKMASLIIQHIQKPANGCVPDHYLQADDGSDSDSSDSDAIFKPAKFSMEKILKDKAFRRRQHQSNIPSGATLSPSDEERLAREFTVLFKLVIHAVSKNGLKTRCRCNTGGTIQLNGEGASGKVPVKMDEKHCLLVETQYKESLKTLQFQSCNIPLEGSCIHHYKSQYTTSASQKSSQTQVIRIVQELSSLSRSLPLELSSGIFVRTDDEKISLMKALITGPEGTPYSSGCFVFDIYFPQSYPLVPPKVNMHTTGNGTVRFNPNLYNCGTVCLSLLGTWQGQNGEEWNEKTSTVLQVLISIQSLIMVPDPYFNEPGYEQYINTDAGRKMSAEYNLGVRTNNINYAMVAQLQHPHPGFEDVIKTHFYMKKDRILEEVGEWVKSSKSSKLSQAVNSLKKEMKKLEPPSSLVNPSKSATTSPSATKSIAKAGSSSVESAV